MSKKAKILRRSPFSSLLLIALIVLFLSAAVIASSLNSWPAQAFPFETPASNALPAESDIAGWSSVERDSYTVGETIRYTITILFREERVDPDIEQLFRSASFTPFEKRTSSANQYMVSDGIQAFVVDFVLQAVNVEPHTTYSLHPATVFYKGDESFEPELQALRIPAPPIFIGGRYPADVSTIPLKALKLRIEEAEVARLSALGLAGAVFGGLGSFTLWFYGRRRRRTELTEEENLWHDFQEIIKSKPDGRTELLSYESIFMRVLDVRTGIGPEEFWAGKEPEEEIWHDVTPQVRDICSENYRALAPSTQSIAEMRALLSKLLSSIITSEERLLKELEVSAYDRLRLQKSVFVFGVMCVTLGVALFILSLNHIEWLDQNLVRYNRAISSVADLTEPRIDEADSLVEVSKVANLRIKAAALYNAGTILAHLLPSGNPALEDREILEAAFRSDISLSDYLDDEKSIAMFFESEKWLRKAVVYLQEAARATPEDLAVLSNLELVIKRHKAVVASIRALFDAQQKGVDPKKDNVRSEAAIDLLNLEWPENIEKDQQEEGKDDTNYKIMERF